MALNKTYWRRMAYYLSTRKERRELFGKPIDELFFKKHNREQKRMETCQHEWGEWDNDVQCCLKCDNRRIRGLKL